MKTPAEILGIINEAAAALNEAAVAIQYLAARLEAANESRDQLAADYRRLLISRSDAEQEKIDEPV